MCLKILKHLWVEAKKKEIVIKELERFSVSYQSQLSELLWIRLLLWSANIAKLSLCHPNVKQDASSYLGGLWNHRDTFDWETKYSVWSCTFFLCLCEPELPTFLSSVWAETSLGPNCGYPCLGWPWGYYLSFCLSGSRFPEEQEDSLHFMLAGSELAVSGWLD